MFSSGIQLLNQVKRIAVFTHINPDGDALGSSVAFKLAMEKLQKEVDLYCDDTIHENYYFLNTQSFYVEHKNKEYDLAVILDCPDVLRIGKYAELYKNISKKIVIDHHLKNNISADLKFVDEKAGSVGIMLYRLFKEMQLPLNKYIAEALYTAISTDTGCFMHSNTTSETHLITAHLMEYNIELEKLNYYLFNKKTKSQMQLLARALNKLQFHEQNKIVLLVIKEEDFKETNTTYDDTIGILNTIRGIEGVDASVILTETQKDCYKVSLRSYYVDVSKIAENFLGGGHKHAAGCKICGKLENVINKLLEATKKEL